MFSLNLLNIESLKPAELADCNIWKYISLIIENTLVMIQDVKTHGKLPDNDE
jgi:golgin subfamily B member 1